MNNTMKTTDYSIFKKHESNRGIDQPNLKRIIASIRARNLLEFRPLLCDEQMRIIDGQHRLEAAKTLGVEIYYQVQEESTHEDIVLLNTNQKTWNINDYVSYHISLGNKDALEIKELATRLNISMKDLIRFLPGRRESTIAAIRTGTVKLPDAIELQQIEEFITKTKTLLEMLRVYIVGERKCLASRLLQQALYKILTNEECNFETLKNKLRLKSESIHKCSDGYGYYTMLRDIYNWKNQNPIA